MDSQLNELDIYLASIPQGCAIVDTGCTTSVIGEQTAATLSTFLQQHGYPAPQEVALPAVELKGFNGKSEVRADHQGTSLDSLSWEVAR